MEISLDMLLKSRDERYKKQQDLLQKYPDKTLLCLTVIMPGSVKRNSSSLFVAQVGKEVLFKEFSSKIVFYEQRDLQTGFEAYIIIDKEKTDVKKILCSIEESHPLGRLFDIDVINSDGVPISRKDIGLPPRKCLICGEESRFCMRNFTHTQEELHSKIQQMIDEYKKSIC
ncbi:MAG: citrate lyase holo-[Bacteroidales bacterium]|nr:citrate lyase holo-[acyl-carrier protein] synthase [Bacteroidales bacterium]